VKGRVLASIAAAAATLALLVFWRHFFLAHAAIVAFAVGALVYSAIGTAGRLRDRFRK
jgi:hypothetical protein